MSNLRPATTTTPPVASPPIVTTIPTNTEITGGTLKGTIKGDKKSPALLEDVRVKKGSKLSGVKLGKGVVVEDK